MPPVPDSLNFLCFHILAWRWGAHSLEWLFAFMPNLHAFFSGGSGIIDGFSCVSDCYVINSIHRQGERFLGE